jgi:NitT/TauT family transport system substrate-binding protein
MQIHVRALPVAVALLVALGLAGLTAAPGSRTAAAPAVLAAAVGRADAVAAAQLTAVRFGSPQSISDAGVFIARERGYFRDQGLDVDVIPFQSGPNTIAPLAAGDLDVAGGTVSTALFNAIERGVGIKAVADKGISQPGFEFSQLVLRRDLADSGQVREIADLRGRRVAIASERSGAESQLAQTLARGGVGIGDVDATVLGFPDMVVALGNRAVDGAVIIEPLLGAAVERGVAVTWEPGYSSAAYGGVYQAAILVVSGRFAAQPDLVRRFLVGYLQGVRAYNDAFAKGEGRPEVVRILTEQTTIKDPTVYDRMQMAGLDPDGRLFRQSLQRDLDYFRQRGYYTGSLTLDDIIDSAYVDYAAQQLGAYR